jgi:hypothetical protein
MKRRLLVTMGLVLGMMLAPAVAPRLQAEGPQAKDEKAQAKDDKAKESRIDGTIQMMDKDAHKVTLRVRGGTAFREVIYNDSTKYTFRNKPATLDDVKDGRRVIVLGTMNEKKQVVARRIDVRDEK